MGKQKIKHIGISFGLGLLTYPIAFIGVAIIIGTLQMIYSWVPSSTYKSSTLSISIQTYIAYSAILISQSCFMVWIGKTLKPRHFSYPIIFGAGSIIPALLGQEWTPSFWILCTICSIVVPTSYYYGVSKQKKSLLSPREEDISRYVKQGKTNKEIAKLLFIEEQTVKNHLSTIYQKLSVRNRVELARKYKF